MAPSPDNKVVEILPPILKWLEEHTPRIAPSHIRRYVSLLDILRACLEDVPEEGPLVLSYRRFLAYCDSHGLSRRSTPKTFIKDCCHLCVWLLPPACHRLSFPGVRITFGASTNPEDPVACVVNETIRPSLRNKLQTIDLSLHDSQWLRMAVARLDKERGKQLLDANEAAPPNRHDDKKLSAPGESSHQPQRMALASQSVADVESWEITLLHYHLQFKSADPQTDVGELERRFRPEFDSIIKEYKGYHLGGREVAFGYKGSSFMHPHTAVQAALRITRTARRFSGNHRSVTCSIVVHTGWTKQVSGTLRLDQPELLGAIDPIVQYQAKMGFPTQVLLTRQAFLCVQDVCDCRRMTITSQLRESTHQHETYELVRQKCQERVYSSGRFCEIPLIGRDNELAVLSRALKEAAAGSPRCVRIRGPLGLGKSRLVDELLREAPIPAENLLVCQCWDYRSNFPFYPLEEMLGNIVKQDRLRVAQTGAKGIRKRARELGPPPRHIADLIVQSIRTTRSTKQDVAGRSQAPESTQGQIAEHCQELLGALVPMVLSLAGQEEPIILLVEDLHWADRHTCQLLHLFLEEMRDASRPCRLLVIITYRGRPHIVDLPDDNMNVLLKPPPLAKPASQELAEQLRRQYKPEMTDETLSGIVDYAEGVPEVLYEQVCGREGRVSWFKKVMTESENRGQDLDGAHSRYVAQKAAILGVPFREDELAATIRYDCKTAGLCDDLQAHLQYLLATGLLRAETIDGEQKYCFSHGHILVCFEESMSSRDYQEQHLIAANALQQHVRGIRRNAPEILAMHYFQAGPTAAGDAIKWLHRAAKADLHRSRNAQARDKLQQALDLAEGTEKKVSPRTQVTLLLDAARSYAALYGSGSQKVQKAYAQAHELVDGTHSELLRFRTQWGLWLVSFIHGNLYHARKQAQDLLLHPACKTHPICRLEAHHAMWDTLFHLGAFTTALAYHFDGMAMMAVSPLKRKRYDYSQFTGHHAPHVCCLARAALSLWLSGFLDQALDASDAAVELAKELECPNSLAHAHAYAAFTSILARVPRTALSHAESAISIAEERKLPQCMMMAEVLRHAATAGLDPQANMVVPLETAVDRWKTARIEVLETLWRALLADACRDCGQISDGLRHVTTGIEVMQQTGELFYAPELYRLRGELLLAEAKTNYRRAEADIRRAAEAARESGAMLLRLRALLSLNRLLASHGRSRDKKSRAQKNLKLVHQKFTQGLDTPDLRDAAAFLSHNS